MSDIVRKVAVINGGAHETNIAIAEKLAAQDINVVVLLDEAYVEGVNLPANVNFFLCNTSSLDDTARCFQSIRETVGDIEILINNPQKNCHKSIADTSPEEWDEIISANLHSLFYCCKQVCADMKERKSGKIINVSSLYYMGAAGQAAYVVSKAGTHGFTSSICNEMSRYGVHVSVITPNHSASPGDIADAISLLCNQESDVMRYMSVNTGAFSIVLEQR